MILPQAVHQFRLDPAMLFFKAKNVEDVTQLRFVYSAQPVTPRTISNPSTSELEIGGFWQGTYCNVESQYPVLEKKNLFVSHFDPVDTEGAKSSF